MVFLEWKMFWKEDKHKQNDQSGIVHPFGKSRRKSNKHKQNDQNKKNTSFWKANNNKKGNDTDFPERKLHIKVEVKADRKWNRKWNGFP